MRVQKRGLFEVDLVVLLFLILLVSIPFSGAETTGCYTYAGTEDESLYCAPGILQSEAAQDCDQHDDCTLLDNFIPNSNCQSIPECELVTCSVDCNFHAAGYCAQLGGQPVSDERYLDQCSPGCCKVGSTFCQFGLNQFQCQQAAAQRGYDFNSLDVSFQNPLEMTLEQCNAQYCHAELTPARIFGVVRAEDGTPLAGALVTLQGMGRETHSSADGSYTFEELTPRTYALSVHLAGYAPSSISLSPAPGEEIEQNFILSVASSTTAVSGVVRDHQGTPLEGAHISWSGPASGVTITDPQGEYQTPELPPGQYTFNAVRTEFQPQEQVIVVSAGEPAEVNFLLEAIAFQGIQGTAFIDLEGTGTGIQQYGVMLYVDGAFRGFSQYPDGRFRIRLPAGAHTILATYQHYQSEEITVQVEEGTAPHQDILLTTHRGECSAEGENPHKPVTVFAATAVPGSKEVLLSWAKPCPEVIRYRIEKAFPDGTRAVITASPAQTTKIDADVEWGQPYAYTIVAEYDAARESIPPAEASITLGNELCAGRHNGIDWETFCLVGNTQTRKAVWSCTDENELYSLSPSCAELDGNGGDYYCSQITSRRAECADAGRCSFLGDPFGLWHSRSACYGAADPANAASYCYYDYTETIVNECRACTEIESCFDYRSEDACAINNCLGTDCQWVDAAAHDEQLVDYGLLNIPGLVTEETGHGYCIEEDYQDDDQCSLCSSDSALFENYYCTAQVCSSIGRCFSDINLAACSSCGDAPTSAANCYSYTTELECTNGEGIRKTPFGEISLSDDQCSWGRCKWLGEENGFASGACVKDSNADGQDDCAAFQIGVEHRTCAIDNTPPRTTIVPAGIKIISQTTPNITFFGDDVHPGSAGQTHALGEVHYCIISSNPTAQQVCTTDNFLSSAAEYPGRDSQELVTVDLLASPFLDRQINGETYRLLFYSLDKYLNQENVQEAFVFVDNVPPAFQISEQITTVGDTTALIAYLEGISEPMSCSFRLAGIVPLGAEQAYTVPRNQQNKEVEFSNLRGLIYNLTVSCADDWGNQNSETKQYTFDLEERIDIITPPLNSFVAGTEIEFSVLTLAGAQCSLYRVGRTGSDSSQGASQGTGGDTLVAPFITDEEGKVHTTAPLPGFVEREYAGEYKVLCTELLTDESYEEYFHFTVDFTPPAVEVILREGSREERPTGFGWEEFFVEHADLDFNCVADGFGCERIFYCLGGSCDSLSNPDYREYTGTVSISDSTFLCYYATDAAGNRPFSPTCGTITIDGYGIVLENPPLHYYLGEQWGTSNQPSFEWQFFTKVPTTECRFDFLPGFTYNAVPGFKVLSPDGDGRYHHPAFPDGTGASPYPATGGMKTVFVRCLNQEGAIGPEEIMHLEYDPSAPAITAAYAEPEELIEGNSVDLFVSTDDKTVCKYSDEGHDEYPLMPFAFPGGEGDLPGADGDEQFTLREDHQTPYSVSGFTGLIQEYQLMTICRNGAGDLSPLETIGFRVDYTQQGGIAFLWPSGDHFTSTNLSARIETTKNAICEYSLDGFYRPFDGAGSTVHTLMLGNLSEQRYQIPVRCTMSDNHVVENILSFTIDRTPPRITAVDDGHYSCGSEFLRVFVSINESNVTAYTYHVFDLGVGLGEERGNTTLAASAPRSFFTPSASSAPRTAVFESTVGSEQPLQVPTANLTEGHRYGIQVSAQDAAGNWGPLADGDGVLVVGRNYSACEEDRDAPLVAVSVEDSCQGTSISLQCTDDLGCREFRYGKSTSLSSCVPELPYNGQQLPFDTNGWVCYYLEDSIGNNHTGNRQVFFADEDGDGISDGCDQCFSTAAGNVVDTLGCAHGEIPEQARSTDADSDTLPDFWEMTYNSISCPFNPSSTDSDMNGISDALEDYDGDGFTNYQEYRRGSDPCQADLPDDQAWPGQGSFPQGPEGAQPKLVAWVFLIIGLLMVGFGIGYLVYYYRKHPSKQPPKESSKTREQTPAEGQPAVQAQPSSWPEFLGFRRKRRAKERARQREAAFRTFDTSSRTIPHMEKFMDVEEPSPSRVKELARTYREHKKELQPGLRTEEKSIFDKVESLAGSGKSASVSKEQAEDVFQKLRSISAKRKGKS